MCWCWFSEDDTSLFEILVLLIGMKMYIKDQFRSGVKGVKVQFSVIKIEWNAFDNGQGTIAPALLLSDFDARIWFGFGWICLWWRDYWSVSSKCLMMIKLRRRQQPVSDFVLWPLGRHIRSFRYGLPPPPSPAVLMDSEKTLLSLPVNLSIKYIGCQIISGRSVRSRHDPSCSVACGANEFWENTWSVLDSYLVSDSSSVPSICPTMWNNIFSGCTFILILITNS